MDVQKTLERLATGLCGLGLLAVVLGLLFPALRWLLAAAGLLACLAGILIYFHPHYLYRPPENHVGVWYRLGRFKSWIAPDRWVVYIPGLDEIRTPIDRRLRPVDLALSPLITSDQVAVECHLRVFFQLNPFTISPGFRAQALHLSDKDWRGLVTAAVRELLPELIAQCAYLETQTPAGRQHLRSQLSQALCQQLVNFGPQVKPEWVSIQSLLPDRAILQAMVEQSRAAALGQAALDRLLPILHAASTRTDSAMEAMLLEWAAAVVGGQTPPPVILALNERERAAR